MPTHVDLPDDRGDDAQEEGTGVRFALKAFLLTFLVIVATLTFMYCLWVFAEVYLMPDDMRVEHCSQLSVEMQQHVC